MSTIKYALIGIGILCLIALMGISWFFGTYNSLVAADQDINNAWGQVESQYQRRIDLIPNLVETVRGYAEHERSTFEAVTEARAHWDKAATPEERIEAARAMEGAIQSMLTIAVENYPQLKADQNFRDLQAQLEGTENRIAVARNRYNDAVRDYNIRTKSWPTSFVARWYGFQTKPYFESDKGAEQAPKVNFTNYVSRKSYEDAIMNKSFNNFMT